MAELMSFQACFSVSSSLPTIPSTIDQQQVETDISRLLEALPLVRPSPDCERRIRPFLCLQVFGLCGSNGTHHTTSRETCTQLRDMICVREWNLAASFLGNDGSDVLPVCESLPYIADECTARGMN